MCSVSVRVYSYEYVGVRVRVSVCKYACVCELDVNWNSWQKLRKNGPPPPYCPNQGRPYSNFLLPPSPQSPPPPHAPVILAGCTSPHSFIHWGFDQMGLITVAAVRQSLALAFSYFSSELDFHERSLAMKCKS
jgi:hypothetical protein